jgi:hypothetical protein
MEIENKDAELKEVIRGREIMRLMQLTRDESVENLLDAALAGRDKSVESVSKLYGFVLRTFGDTSGFTPSTVTRKFWNACSEFLRREAGLTDTELSKIKNPHPKAGEPGFRSVLDEFEEEGLA